MMGPKSGKGNTGRGHHGKFSAQRTIYALSGSSGGDPAGEIAAFCD